MNVLWLAKYPYDFVVEKTKSRPQAVPWIIELAKHISKQHKLTIFSFSWRIKKNVMVNKEGIQFVFIKVPNPLLNILTLNIIQIKRFRKWLKKNIHHFELMHIHGVEFQFGFSSRNLSVPSVISIQGFVHQCLPYKSKLSFGYFYWLVASLYEKYEIKHFKNFICRTHWDKKIIKQNNEQARIFSNWEILREEFFINEFTANFESYDIVFMGGTNQMKGIHDALRIIDRFNKRGLRFNLKIIGYGSVNAIERIIKNEKLTISKDQINFLGFKDAAEITVIFRNSFCMIYPSLIDNSPNAVCEAQVCGLPVISHDTGGISTLIEQNLTGILINMHEIDSFVLNILKLKEDRSLFYLIQNNSMEIARKRHNPDQIVKELLGIYSQLTFRKD